MHNPERRKFIRYECDKPIQYKKVILAEDKIVASKLVDACSKNLSANGILLSTKYPPELSSIIVLYLENRNNPLSRQIRKQIMMLNNGILGRVVRTDVIGDGEYNVGIAFFTKSEKLAEDIKYMTHKIKWNRLRNFVFRGVLVLLVAIILLAINFIHSQQKRLYVPGDRVITLTPTSIDLNYEDVYFRTTDRQSINGWFIPASNAKITLLYFHGNEGNMTDRLPRINFFHNMGMNILIFDYRGYGKSSGKPSEQGFYKDAQAAYDYLISRNDIDKDKIIAIGVSLGGPVAADLCLKRKVKALILESTFVSLLSYVQDLYPALPVKFLVREKFDTLEKMKNIKIPKLITHGVDDEVVLYKHARYLYDAASYPKKFLSFHGGHSDDIYVLSDTFREALQKFINENNIL